MLIPALRRRRAASVDRRAPLVEPVADEVAWEVLREALRQGQDIADRINARCTFRTRGGPEGAVLETSEPCSATLELELASGIAHRFWCGQTREALLVLQDAIRLSGSTAATFEFLRTLPDISRAYRRAAGIHLESAPRLSVLRYLKVTPDTVTVLGLSESFTSAADDDCVAFTAALILGLHPLCRAIELRGIASALSREQVARHRVAALTKTLAGLSIRDPRIAPPAAVS
jgi:hypothetical protein